MTRTKKLIIAALALALLYGIDAARFYLHFNSLNLDCAGAVLHIHENDLECKKMQSD